MTKDSQNAAGFSVREQFAGHEGAARPPSPRPPFPAASPVSGSPRPPRPSGQPPLRHRFTVETLAKSLDWLKVLRGVARRSWMIALFTVAIGVLGIAAGLRAARVSYEARASLLYRPDWQKNMLQSSGSTFSTRGLSRTTAVSMIRRTRNLEQVHAALSPPLSVEDIRWRIESKSDKGSDIVLLVFSAAPTREIGVAILNELIRVALADNAAFYRSQAEQAAAAFRTQGLAAQGELDRLTEALAEYQSKHQLTGSAADAQAFLGSLAAASERLGAARIAYESQQVRLANYRQIIAELPDEVLRESIEDNPLKRRISNTEVALMEARTKYGPENPRVRLLEDNIKEMRRLMTDKDFNQSREQVFEPNPAKQQFATELLRLEAEQDVLAGNLARQEEAYAAVVQRFAHLPRQQIEVAGMQQQRLVAEDLCRAMEKSADNAMMAAMLDLSDFEVLEPARVGSVHRSPRVWMFPLAAILAGGMLGTLLATALEVFDPKLRTVRQVELAYAPPCLGVVVRGADTGTETMSRRFLPICRTIYEQVTRAQDGRPRGHSLAVAGAAHGDGKSTLAWQLARYWARQGIATAYVDFSDPQGSPQPEPSPPCGIDEYLRGTASWKQIVASRDGVACLALRHPAPDLQELLHTEAMARLRETLRATYALVIIEVPALADTPGASLLAAMADQCVFIIGSATTTKAAVDLAIDRLDQEGVRPLGLILNLVEGHDA